jgi:hypothetical protein
VRNVANAFAKARSIGAVQLVVFLVGLLVLTGVAIISAKADPALWISSAVFCRSCKAFRFALLLKPWARVSRMARRCATACLYRINGIGKLWLRSRLLHALGLSAPRAGRSVT